MVFVSIKWKSVNDIEFAKKQLNNNCQSQLGLRIDYCNCQILVAMELKVEDIMFSLNTLSAIEYKLL